MFYGISSWHEWVAYVAMTVFVVFVLVFGTRD